MLSALWPPDVPMSQAFIATILDTQCQGDLEVSSSWTETSLDFSGFVLQAIPGEVCRASIPSVFLQEAVVYQALRSTSTAGSSDIA